MDQSGDRYYTILYGVIDVEDNEFRYIAAGHRPVIHWNAEQAPTMVELGGLAIGRLDDAEFEEQRLQLKKGDRLCIYTDGIPEAMNADLEQFGNQQLPDTIDSNRTNTLDNLIEKLLGKIESWSSPNGLKDDVTILAVEIM